MEHLVDFFINNLGGVLSKEAIVFIISMTPILELRGGLLAASLLGIPITKAIPICIVGNIIPIPFILLFIKKIFSVLRKVPFMTKIIDWLETRAMNKSDKIAAGEFVGLMLFVGIPCQVAALKGLRRQYPGKLICADLLCHGTCAPEDLSAELTFLTSGAEGAVDISFREGPQFRMTVWLNGRRVSCKKAAQSAYLRGYLEGVTLREACYRCPFACLDRTGDITLGDFIGAEPRNASFAWPHTPEAEALLLQCGAAMQKHRLEDRMAYRLGLLEPTHRPKERDAFLRARARLPFPSAVRRTLRFRMGTEPFRQAWKWLHHQAHIVKKALS